jgi:hypothetical protein
MIFVRDEIIGMPMARKWFKDTRAPERASQKIVTDTCHGFARSPFRASSSLNIVIFSAIFMGFSFSVHVLFFSSPAPSSLPCPSSPG